MPSFFDTGFTVREPAWHGLGVVLEDFPGSIDEARQHAGLAWDPVTAPVYARTTSASGPGGLEVEEFLPVPGHKLITRSDTGSVLAVPKSSYEVITNRETFEIVEAVLDQPNVKWESAGAVRDGALVWALARIDEPFEIPGDPSPAYPYVTMLNAHDGTAACKVLYTSVRVVCWNTFQLASAEGDRHGHQFTFRHTKNVRDRIEDAKLALAGARDEAAEYRELMTELVGIKVTPTQAKRYIAEFIPSPPEAVISDRVASNVAEARNAVWRILRGDNGSLTPEVAGTAYGLVQASTEYLDHVRGWKKAETKFGRQLLRAEPLKAKAVKLAREVAASA